MSVTITLPETMVRRGKGHWKINITLLKERSFKEEMIAGVSQWRTHIRRYKNTLDWWDNYAKKLLKGLFVRCGTEKNNDENAYTNFLHSCIYEILQSDASERTKKTALNQTKAQLLLLQKQKMETVILNIQQHVPGPTENISLFHLIKSKRKKASTMISSISDGEGTEQRTMGGILRTFTRHMQHRYKASPIDEASWDVIDQSSGMPLSVAQQQELQAPITRDEIRKAIFSGPRHKAPGSDGLCLEFYQETWDDLSDLWEHIFQLVFTSGELTAKQKLGIIVCVPKKHNPEQSTILGQSPC
jgi:hypothetical protein